MKYRSWIWLAAVLVLASGFGPPAAPAEPDGQTKAAKPKADLGKEREKLLGSIPLTQPGVFENAPNAQDDYVYEAASARPLVEGLTLFKFESDTPVHGLTTAVTGTVKDGDFSLTSPLVEGNSLAKTSKSSMMMRLLEITGAGR